MRQATHKIKPRQRKRIGQTIRAAAKKTINHAAGARLHKTDRVKQDKSQSQDRQDGKD